jgi:hypothetical protein
MKSIVLRLTGALILTFSVIVGTVRYMGEAYAKPQQVFSFDPPDCYLPCVFGITPGKTTWAEYRELITSNVAAVQQNFGGDSDFWLKDSAGTRVDLLANYLGRDNLKQTITYLTISTSDGKVTTLGKLLDPQHISVRVFRYRNFAPGGGLNFVIIDKNYRLAASVWAEDRVSPDTPIDSLTVFDNSEAADAELLHVMSAPEIRWLGFASVDKYASEPLKQ